MNLNNYTKFLIELKTIASIILGHAKLKNYMNNKNKDMLTLIQLYEFICILGD